MQRETFHWHETHNGSAHHYWHFLLGYFLPLMRQLLWTDGPRPARIGLYDCGPVMNRVLLEGLARLNVEPVFEKALFREAAPDNLPLPGMTGTVLDRWDV